MSVNPIKFLRQLATMRRRNPMQLFGWLAIVPAVVLTVIFFVLPMLYMLRISFFEHIAGGLMEPAFIIDNYRDFFTDRFYLESTLQTLVYGIIVAAVSFVLGFPLAYTLVRTRFPGRPILLGIVLYPLLTNALVLVFAWLVILGNQGPVNRLLALIQPGREPLRILGTSTAVILAMIHAALPFMVIPLMAAISNIPPSLEDAAASLGASRGRMLYHVVLPLAMPGILGGSLISFTTVLSGFLFPLYLGSNATNILPLQIYRKVGEAANWPFGATMTFAVLLMTLVLIGVGSSGISLARRFSRGSVR